MLVWKAPPAATRALELGASLTTAQRNDLVCRCSDQQLRNRNGDEGLAYWMWTFLLPEPSQMVFGS
jgi:hypothetical protein